MKFIAAYAVMALTFLAIDIVWLGYVARSLYKEHLGPLMVENIDLGAATGFYLLYVLGVVVFVVMPALQSGGWQRAVMMGALFGLVAYATFDLTNLAVMKGYPATIAFIDMAWGAVLTATSAGLTTAVIATAFD